MSDQAQTLRSLMARATKVAPQPTAAPFEPSSGTTVETCPDVEPTAQDESCLGVDDFRATDDLPVVDESLFAARVASVLDWPVTEIDEDSDSDFDSEFDEDKIDDSCDTLSTDSDAPAAARPRPRIALLVGGRRGVGATTLAVRLASAMSGLSEEVAVYGIDELPDGIDWNRENSTEPTPAAAFEDDTNWVVVDGGSEITPRLEQLWRSADSVTVITTTDASSVTGSYRLMKSAVARGLSLNSVGLMVNQAMDEHDAQRTGSRIRRCCEQFLDHCQREPHWVAFDAAACGAVNACDVLDEAKDDLRTNANRNVKNWADRVWSLPRSEQRTN